jgi:endo-1,4-beta-D-glucanase Y
MGMSSRRCRTWALWVTAFVALLVGCGEGRTDTNDETVAQDQSAVLSVPSVCNAASGFCWPYRPGSFGINTGITWNSTVQSRIETLWNDYRNGLVVDAGIAVQNSGTRKRINSNPGDTVSEGMSYVITLSALFDEQSILDPLTRFVLDFLDEDGLMHWRIGNCGSSCSPIGFGEAPDATDDMLYGWAIACRKVNSGAWASSPSFNVTGPGGGTGKNYCDLVSIFSKRYRDSFIDQNGATNDGSGNWNGGVQGTHTGSELMAGNRWCMDATLPSSDGDTGACGERFPNGIVNMSYFDPGLYVNVDTANASFWNAVNSRQYGMIATMQTGRCSGLVPQWNNYASACQQVSWQGAQSCTWSYDGARMAYRLTRDYMWNASTSARDRLRPLGNYFASITNNGQTGPCNSTTDQTCSSGGIFFAANSACAIWVASNSGGLVAVPSTCGSSSGSLQRTAQQMFDYVRNDTSSNTDYYPAAWRLLSLVLLSGNMPKPVLTGGPPPIPPAPTGLAATAGNQQVALTWNASTGATSYTVLRATVSGGPYTSVQTGVTTTSFTNTNLTNGTTYFYVVRAVNASGTSGNSNQASATPTAGAPPAPTNLVATPGNQQVALTWSASTGATSYTVLRATVSGGPYTSVQTGVTATNFTNTSLTNGTTYFYVVRAVNASGTSGNSNQASATPTAGGSTPCAGLCTTPTVFTSSNFQSGNLGPSARCFETTANLNGGNCSNMSSRTLTINAGAAQSCNGFAYPAKRNNGYCIQVTAGSPDWASFSTW